MICCCRSRRPPTPEEDTWFLLEQPPALSEAERWETRIIEDENQIIAELAEESNYARKQMEKEIRGKRFEYLQADASFTEPSFEIQLGDIRVGACKSVGNCFVMQDEYLIESFDLEKYGNVPLFAVFDGHGYGGEECARYVKDNLIQNLRQALLEFNPDSLTTKGIYNAFTQALVRINTDLKDNFATGGSTATIAMMINKELWTGNVGDSRTCLDNTGLPEQLSEDADARDPRYHADIEKLGGVLAPGFSEDGLRVGGRIAPARCFGDADVKGLSARPKITVRQLADIWKESHLILISDGVHNHVSTKQLVEAVHADRDESPVQIARNVIRSVKKLKSENATILIARLK